MAAIHAFSLKVGASHGIWQYKHRGTHDRVLVPGLQSILDETCRLLGFGRSDRSAVYLFRFSAEPFDGFQVCVERLREEAHGSWYRVRKTTIGTFKARALFPTEVKIEYLGEWPERIYFQLEKSLTGGIES